MGSLESDIVDAARYLRSVRPIDPAELTEYTAVDTDPERVASVLRDRALELELVEREDGTFVPPGEAPIESTGLPIESLPPALDELLVDRLTTRRGSEWATGEAGMSFRAVVRDLKARYLEGGDPGYDSDDADAYLLYHFPRSYVATRYVIAELVEAGLLGRSLRVLDIGAGVGAHLAAIDAIAPEDALLEYIAVEPSPLVEHLEAVSSTTGRNTHVTVHRSPFETAAVEGTFDLVLLGNVLSEVNDAEVFARRALDVVDADGSLVCIAPADPRTSVQLRRVERALEYRASVFSPTIRLWPGRRPTDECWSFVEHPPISTPTVQRDLAAEADDRAPYINTEIRTSYSILRPDGRRRYPIDASDARVVALGDVESAVGDRVDALAVKLSGDLAEAANPVYRIGDGSQDVPVFAVHVAPGALSTALPSAPYGAVLRLDRTLVLWNEDEGAINLVVDDETLVEQVAP